MPDSYGQRQSSRFVFKRSRRNQRRNGGISETFFEYEGGTEKIIFQLALLTLEMHLIASLPPMFLSVKRARNLSFNGLVMEVVQADNRLLNSNFNQ